MNSLIQKLKRNKVKISNIEKPENKIPVIEKPEINYIVIEKTINKIKKIKQKLKNH